MKYSLAPILRSRAEAIRLSEDEYRSIARAKDGLLMLVGIEQKFDLVLENYTELEKEILDIALRQVVFRDFEYQSLQQESLAIVRRLGNLLSTTKLYLDSTRHDLSTLFGKEHDIFLAIERKCSEEYDAAPGYRLMETLRGMMQHRSISGINLKYASNAESTSQGHSVRTRVLPVFDVAHLKKSGIKAAVRDELGEETDAVTAHVRQYIDAIAQLHYEVRRLTSADRLRWEQVYRSAYAKGADAWPKGEMRASDLIAVDSDGLVRESRHIFLEPLDYLSSLERKNAGPLRLAKMYVSSSVD
jgi:hypothetical protein